MKKLTLSLLVAFFALVLASCSSNPTEVTVENFKSQAKDLVEKEVTITGVAKHICQHSGRKLFLAPLTESEELVTVFTNNDMQPFDKETIGKTYTVNGIVKITETIDENYLDKWEDEVNEQLMKGETMEEEGHCGTEAKAAGVEVSEKEGNPQLLQIKAYRKKLAENNGEPLVFYHIECNSYEIK